MNLRDSHRWLAGVVLVLLGAVAGTSVQAGWVPAVGSPRVLVLLINFNNTTTTYSPAQLNQRIFGLGVGSVRDYFLDVSYGQLDLQGDVYGWYPASQSHDYYTYYPPGTYGRWASYYPKNMYRLAEEAVDAAHAAGADFSLYDNDADGEADAIIILHQGEGGEINGHSNDIWTTIDMISRGGGQARAYNGVIVDAFMIVPEINPWGGMVNIGPIAHEFGHLMGMIDSYDYDASSRGVGVYDLMCKGVWGADPTVYTPDQPAHPSPWQKVLMGWITPTVVTPATQGLQSVPAFETNPVVWKVPANPDDNREYFLLANLTRTGNHATLPSEGLSIWHVDDRALFQNERESRGCTSIFPRLALEQADGYFDLEDKVNWGDTTDLYPGGGAYRSFSGSTTPSSKNYACYLSGVAVANISDPASTMTAEVWLDRYVSGLSAPDLKIKSYQVIPMTGDGDGYFEPGERFQLALTLVNDGATATGVTATLNPVGWYTVNQNTSSFPNLAPGGTAGGAPALDSTIKSDITSAYNYSRFYWYITLKANAGAYSKAAYIYFRIGHPALLYVDDDGGQYVDNYLKTGLDYYLYFYDTWEVAPKGAPTAADLSNYARVLWATGTDRPEPLSPAEQSALAGYLDAGGQLLLSSPYLLVNPSAATLAFAQNYLHVASYFDDRYAAEKIQGITNDPISHSSLSFNYFLGWPYFPLYNRTVGLIPGAGAAGSVFNDYNHFTVIRYPEPYGPGPRVIFLTYALESSYNKGNLPFLLRRYLNGFSYQTGEPFAWDINPGSGQLKQLNELLTITGINFQPSTTFAFPLGGITITNQQYISDRQVQITIRIAYNARMDYHTLAAQNPSGPSIVLDKYFRVVGPMLPNQKPVANAGPDKAGYRSDSFTLEGSGSDPDYDYPIRYKWTRVQGASVTLLPGDTAAQPSFTPNPSYAGKYIFSLTVYDALNLASNADTVTVTVWNLPPSANAGPDQADYRGSPFVLDGSGSSDPEGDPLTFQWTQLAGATVTLVPGNTAATPSFDPARAGSYLFSLVVHDGYDLSPGDTVRVTVLNYPPVADAGPDQTDEVLKRITFDTGLSADPDNDPLLEYSWVQYQGLPVTLNTDDPVHPYFDAPQVGTYRFGLRVFDGYDWSLNEDMVLAEVTPHFNHAPVAIAGPDRQGYRADSFLLDGSGSYDPDAEPITYQWSQLQGPAVTLLPGGTAEMPTFSPDPSYIGLYLFSLVVSDGVSVSLGDTVQVQVLNHLPVAAAGPDQVAVIATLVTLDGSGSSDLDGDTLSYQWTQIFGPAATLNTSDPVHPTFQPDTVGNYVFDLRVNDGFDDSLNADAVEIIIKTLGNQLPVPVPGPDLIVSFYDPAPVPLDGTASYDPDGTILGYAWELESRPAGSAAALSDPSSPQPAFNDDVPGIYLLSLRVRDNEVWSFKAYTTVTSDANRDSDGDTIIDYLDPDDDNDQMPDTWEMANGLNAYDPSDGGLDLNPLTDPDNDGLANLNEFFNESDPQQPDPVCHPAGCFFLDADGDQEISTNDQAVLSLYLNRRDPSYRKVFPPNGDTQDFDGDGELTTMDLSLYRLMLNGRKPACSGCPGPMTLLEPAGSLPSVQVGATIRITAETHALNTGCPRAGLAVVFEVISGSGAFFGGDGETPPRRTLAEHSALNSIARESAFSISRDGLEIFFASNRDGSSVGLDIYRAVRTSVNESFGPPVNVSEINTPVDETGPSISADRLTLYFAGYTATNDFDLYTATRPALDQPFDPPQPISELNTYQWQLHPMPSDDQLRLYFVQWIDFTWNYNLLLAERSSLGSPFGSPAWMANLNTASNESFPFLASDELTIIFSSDRPAKKAGYNLWMATRASIANGFGNLTELYRVNTSGDEYDAHLSDDGLRLTLSSSGYAGPGEMDLWEVTRASTALPFYVTDNPGRFDISGPIRSGGGQNAYGRAVLRFQPTAPGLVEIVVSSPADPRRYIPASAVETIIQVQVP